MTRLLIAALALVLAGCGRRQTTHGPSSISQALVDKYELYSQLAPRDWFDTDCDGLLFKSLLNAGSERAFPVEQAREADEHWLRTPPPTKCNPTSRDMHLGLWWYAWALKRVDLVDADFSYGEHHAFIMDGGNKGISLLLPDEISTLALVEHRLGGAEHEVWKLPTACTSKLGGFEANLQALVIGLRALMDAGDSTNRSCIEGLAAKQPNNAFFSAVAGLYSGDQSHTTDLLLNTTLFPADRLPTSADRCEPYLWQRDEGKDWLPCPDQTKTHSGADLLLAAAIALGKLQ